ncbi:SDR family NAD(P)-dependent oxidoreductase, partial [Allomesorhizobium camelthorni]
MTAAPPVASLLDLSGKTAIVTGASGGIGAGITLLFGEAGASVVCHYNSNRQAAETVAEAIRSAGRQAVACQADISSGTDSANLVAEAISHFGGVDILVNNAGQQPVEMLAEMSESNWNAMMGANVAGPFLL